MNGLLYLYCLKLLMKRHFKILFLIVFCIKVTGQDYNIRLKFRNINIHNGLSNNNVTCLIQDHEGYLWFGTTNGLNRFDGKEVKIYKNNPLDSASIGGTIIQYLFEDNNNRMWVATNIGVKWYDRKNDRFVDPQIEDLKKVSVKCIIQTSDNKYWFATYGAGVICCNTGFDTVKNYTLSGSTGLTICSDVINSLFEDSNGNIWISSNDNGLSILNTGSGLVKNINAAGNNLSVSSNIIFSVYEDSYQDVWICTVNGLNKYIIKEKQIVKYSSGEEYAKLPSAIIIKATEDTCKNLWITTNQGLCLYDRVKNGFIRYIMNSTEEEKLKSNQFFDIYIDHQNIIWLGTNKNGVVYAYPDKNNFNAIPYICTVLKNISVTRIINDSKNNIWIGTNGMGLYCFDLSRNIYKHFPKIPIDFSQPGGTSVFAIYEDSYGFIWTGTYLGGLCRYNPKTNEFINYLHDPDDTNSISHNDVRDIYKDSYGNFWVATNGGGLNLFDKKSAEFKVFRNNPDDTNTICSDWCLNIIEDKEHYLWISTYNGLAKFNPVTGAFYNYLNNPDDITSISNNWVYCVYEDSKGGIWIGTIEGLNKLDKETGLIKRYYTADGLPDNTINGITEDSEGKLWITTNNGISCFNTVTGIFRNYGINDGLQDLEYTYEAIYRKNNMLFFGGINGINIYDENNTIKNLFIPSVKIKRISVFNHPLKNEQVESGRIILKHFQNSISFEYIALNFIDLENNDYKYRLEGFEDAWNYTKSNYCIYTNLSPGSYIFEVKGSNNDDIWNEEGKSIKIVIRPPFWKTKAAYIVYIVLLMLAIFLYRKYTLIKISVKNDLVLEHYKNEHNEELSRLKDRFFTNITHELRTYLTLISGPVDKLVQNKKSDNNDLNIIKRNTLRLKRLVNQLMEYRKVETGNLKLKLRHADIISFIQQVISLFEGIAEQKNIRISHTSDAEQLDIWFDPDKIEKIISNLILNSVKFTEAGGIVSVNIESDDDEYIKICISDTGKGIPESELKNIFLEFYQVSGDSGKTGTGIGLALVRELVELHKGKINVRSDEGKGSCFNIYIPKSKEKYDINSFEKERLDEINLAETNEIISIENVNITVSTDNKTIHNKDHTVLIAEDNTELRSMLAGILVQKFNIIEASNGNEAIETALEKLPDLIISDVVMPETDGITLCHTLKNNLLTSHIPIIIITAQQEETLKNKGLQAGANDYILKPFETSEIWHKTNNVLNNQKNLREMFKRDFLLSPSQSVPVDLDEKFLIKLMEIVENNFKNSSFNVDILAAEMGMSRSVLYRKMNSLVNNTPNDFINIIRLKKAGNLLVNTKYKISEIAYEVGFKDPLYFSRCFKKQYKMSPSEFSERNKNVQS